MRLHIVSGDTAYLGCAHCGGELFPIMRLHIVSGDYLKMQNRARLREFPIMRLHIVSGDQLLCNICSLGRFQLCASTLLVETNDW